MTEKEFNLLDEKWILAVDEDGRMGAYSLKGIFEEAHKLKRLSGEIPTQDAAVLRLLLAVLYAVYQNHDENGDEKVMATEDEAFARWSALWRRGKFDTDAISTYLESYRDRFYLFHPTRPFYQVPIEKGTEYYAAKLNGELSESSNKPRLFSSISGKDRREMGFAEATRWLINLNAFDDTSAKPTVRGGNMPSCGAGWMGKLGLVVIQEDDLFKTLLLNLVLVSDDGEPFPVGVPTWEPENSKNDERTPIQMPESPVEILTLQSRRIHLKRTGQTVEGYYLMGGDIVDKENAFIEQMTLWHQDSEGNVVPRRHDPARSMWRDYQSIMVKNLDSGRNRIPGVVRWARELEDRGMIGLDTVTVSVVGVKFADKDFFVENYTSDSLTVNSGLLSDLNEEWNVRIADAVSSTDRCMSLLWRYAGEVSEVCGCDDISKRAASDRAKVRAYREIDGPFRQWLRSIDPVTDDLDDKVNEWSEKVYRIMRTQARIILEEAGERALTGKDGKSAFTAYRKFLGGLYKETHGGVDNE